MPTGRRELKKHFIDNKLDSAAEPAVPKLYAYSWLTALACTVVVAI